MSRFTGFLFAVGLLLSSTLFSSAQNPEPPGWFAADTHVHRSCGGPPESISAMRDKMNPQNLAALSLLADMGNGEVRDAEHDLYRVNGYDDPISSPGRILHWDAEWHWDATYTQYRHQALGGHIVSLGLKEAHQIWVESTSSVITWAHRQNAISGFAHLRHLDAGFPKKLDCCTPVEYPVEIALGSADFISERVVGNEPFLQAYYRLLNSGFRPGFVAGTDYPCNERKVGAPLTYVRIPNGVMDYRNIVDGLSAGRTVLSLNGHNEFLDLKVNSTAAPGDEVPLTAPGSLPVTVRWTSMQPLTGTIELIHNGIVIASQQGSVTSNSPLTLNATVQFPKSGWIAARLRGATEITLHTAAVFVPVSNAPIRINSADPQFYVDWMDSLISRTSPGGEWNHFFPTELDSVQARYKSARALYHQIALEAQGAAPKLSSINITPAGGSIPLGETRQFVATGLYSDGTSLDLTGQVRWSSANPGVAGLSLRGLAVARKAGTTLVTASLGDAKADTSINVNIAPLAITTQSLPSATVGVDYSATLAANGGTPPYRWSTRGSLPDGLSLNSATGTISGTSAAVGRFAFTSQVSDSGNTEQTATRPETITAYSRPSNVRRAIFVACLSLVLLLAILFFMLRFRHSRKK